MNNNTNPGRLSNRRIVKKQHQQQQNTLNREQKKNDVHDWKKKQKLCVRLPKNSSDLVSIYKKGKKSLELFSSYYFFFFLSIFLFFKLDPFNMLISLI